MKTIKGNKKLNFSREEVLETISGYNQVEVDLGTGDGRFVFKMAKQNPDTFFIGVDPSEPQLAEFSKKANRQKLENVMFVIGSIEVFPEELMGLASKLYINLPWGTLLKETIQPSQKTLATLNQLLTPNAELEILLGYDPAFEPSETSRLNLPEISLEFLTTQTIITYKAGGYENTEISELQKVDLSNIETTWGKKLAHGNPRKIFRLKFVKN